MDGRRFDRLTRLLAAPGTRRGLLAAWPVVGGFVTVLGAMRGEETAAAELPVDRVRRRAGKHQQGQHHPNQHKRNRKAKGHAGNSGSGDCTQSRNGSSCGGTSQCWDGRCLAAPTCLGTNARTDQQCSRCCSNGCGRATDNQEWFCFVGVAGDPCHDNDDCSIPIGKCVAFRCT